MEQLHRYNNHGQLLVELLVALAVSAILIPAIMTGFIASRQGVAQARQRLEATALAREAGDAVFIVRDAGWSNVATNGTYHPVIADATWTLVTGSAEVNGYTESLVISDVSRDATGNMVTTGGTVDPSTKKITVTISWGLPILSSVIETLYITRLTNLSWIQTTQADFDAGVKTDVITTNNNGGEITLGAGGKADWCEPNLSITALNLPKNGVANALSAVPGHVVAGTGENSSGISFANILVTDTDPPTSSISGTFDGYKTNGVFNDSNYAYIATDNHSKEMIILDLNQLNPVTKKYTEVGYFNAPDNNEGKSVYVSGNIGFLTVDNILYTINLSSKTGSRPQLASRTLAANGTKVVVNGTYAFVSIAGATQELQIVQFNAAGTTLTITGSADVNGQAAYDVSVNSTGTRAYLATGADSSKPEFFIINTSSKSGSRPTVGSYNANGMDPNAVAVVTSNKAILVGTGGEEYQVIDITNEANPVRCGGLQVNSGINGLASVLEGDGDAYTYIITGDSADELKIIEGGPGGKYVVSGTFESSILDATRSSVFNRFFANSLLPVNTDIQYQVSGADAVSGSCTGAAFTYVGPDGTGATKFSTGSAVPLSVGPGYKNPARCFRYKAFLSTSDQSAAPIVTDMTVNYSP
ncbi:MAG: hypothetical protein NT149_01100 [Candidatus Gottesmanbacteria bacterium]|nr:hypothetical protein [Candidatus Gottesmanbacteria bacterium]